MELNTIYQGDCLEGLASLPDTCIDCCVTSPPYWGLRDYGHDDQLGLEDTPEQYVENMVRVFAEVRRVLKPEGTLWLNLGDSYWGGKGKSGASTPESAIKREGKTLEKTQHCIGRKGEIKPGDGKHDTIKPKDLVGIPWRTAFALQADGWWLRQDIIWHKPNPMPESVTDRCTKAHEYIFLMSKSKAYYYDNEAIKEKSVSTYKSKDFIPSSKKDKQAIKATCATGASPNGRTCKTIRSANKRSVWTVTTKPYKEAHFATYPPELITPCILAGCPAGGVVLDPFMGSGTTAMVALQNNRNFVGFELNEEYIGIASKRIAPFLKQSRLMGDLGT